MRFFEEIALGEETDYGSYRFDAAEIVDFASKWDPQRFHLDEEAAKQSHFGGLVASGWHTACVWMKLYAAHNDAKRQLRRSAGLPVPRYGASPGFRDMVWRRPVYAGDVLEYRGTVTEKRPLKSRPDWGLVTSRNEAVNQKGELAFAFTAQVLIERQSPA